MSDGFSTSMMFRAAWSSFRRRSVAFASSAVAVAAPDPTTGVVTGQLTGTDIDRDPLTYRVVTWPAKGSITRNVATTADASRISFPHTPADLADTFSVMISDGYGGSVTVPIG